MPKFSVKKPYFILVAVLALIVLGITGFTRMTTDFLPDMELPYMVIMTPDPGASPQKAESEITNPMEDAVSTISGIKNVSSLSANNMSQVMLEFEHGTDMDGAMVKVTSAVNQLELPENAGKPIIMEISMDMMPVTYLSVDKKGYDSVKLTKYVEDSVIPTLKRQDGVASVQSAGMIKEQLQIKLNQHKVDQVNQQIHDKVAAEFDDAQADLDEASSKLDKAEKKLKKSKKKLKKQQKKTSKRMATYTKLMNQALSTQSAYQSQLDSIKAYQGALNAELGFYQKMGLTNDRTKAIQEELNNLKTEQAAAEQALNMVNNQVSQATENYSKVEEGKLSAAAAFGSGNAQMAQAESSLKSSRQEIKDGYKSLEKSRKKALKAANANQLLSLDTLSGILSAQNFSMPAGSIGKGSNEYLLRIDNNLSSQNELESLVLTHIDKVGDIHVYDVADVKIANNAGETYAKVNGQDAVILSVFKTSSAGTASVSQSVEAALRDMHQKDKSLRFLTLMDQGDYIDLVTTSVFKNLLYGAILAIIVLFLFLRDIRPTAVVALSIPLSVIASLLIMYFAGITLNVLSLSGLALGIGMLVDNSIVVMENIYRMRNRGESAARAAVAGANQVAGAIAASTLTTICVFLPILFTDGLSRDLLEDMCFTISLSLLASLVIALTVVPALSSTLMRGSQEKDHRFLNKLQEKYAGALSFCLKRKWLPLLVAVVLLVLCAGKVFTTGIVLMPSIGSDQMSMSFTADKESTDEENYKLMDELSREVRAIDGVKTVGAVQTANLGMGETDNANYTALILLKEEAAHRNSEIAGKIRKIMEKAGCEDFQVAESNMDTSSVMSQGLSVDITGDDENKLLALSKDVMAIVEKENGFRKVENGQEAASRELVLHIDEDAAMRCGLTVAQIYQALNTKLTEDKTATKVTLKDNDMDVVLKDTRQPLTRKNLLDFKIEAEKTKADGTTTTKKYRLGKFADFTERDSLASISHQNGSKRITVTAETVEGYNTTLLSRKLQKKIDAMDVPEGYNISIGGETEDVSKMVRDMLLMMLVAVILIYLIMVAQFTGFLAPFIIMFTIPLAFTGGFLALMIAGMELSMVSMMGFLMLSGVIVNNGIVFIDYVNQLRRAGMEKRAALIQAGQNRMRPILMTAFTTVLSMSAIALSRDPGAEMSQGMAVVVIGGLLYATFMTLFIVPILYDLLFRRKELKVVDLGDESTL